MLEQAGSLRATLRHNCEAHLAVKAKSTQIRISHDPLVAFLQIIDQMTSKATMLSICAHGHQREFSQARIVLLNDTAAKDDMRGGSITDQV